MSPSGAAQKVSTSLVVVPVPRWLPIFKTIPWAISQYREDCKHRERKSSWAPWQYLRKNCKKNFGDVKFLSYLHSPVHWRCLKGGTWCNFPASRCCAPACWSLGSLPEHCWSCPRKLWEWVSFKHPLTLHFWKSGWELQCSDNLLRGKVNWRKGSFFSTKTIALNATRKFMKKSHVHDLLHLNLHFDLLFSSMALLVHLVLLLQLSLLTKSTGTPPSSLGLTWTDKIQLTTLLITHTKRGCLAC